jgi:hypothetical protein
MAAIGRVLKAVAALGSVPPMASAAYALGMMTGIQDPNARTQPAEALVLKECGAGKYFFCRRHFWRVASREIASFFDECFTLTEPLCVQA